MQDNKNKRIIGIIPARYASKRFPGKPLAKIDGVPMVLRVYNQAKKADLSDVWVATDNEQIKQTIEAASGKAILTPEHCKNGTERCFEALKKIGTSPDAIINIQGDEPYIHPEQINQVANMLRQSDSIATLAKEIDSNKTNVNNTNIVKVVFSNQMKALYFSRLPVPFANNIETNPSIYFKHIGIYGYPADILTKIVKLPSAEIEKKEQLEQLRWLANGYDIQVNITQYESTSIDVPDDIAKVAKNKE